MARKDDSFSPPPPPTLQTWNWIRALPQPFPCLMLHSQESCVTQYDGHIYSRNHSLLTTQETMHFNFGPVVSSMIQVWVFLSVEIYGFASNLLPAVFSGVLQSCLCCHLSYFHRPAYLFLVTNVKHHSPGIEFSWRISQRSLPLNLK